ncbi:BgTH12-06008 [Blumeria graminis f. sp. triticale]|uniref:BgTH12-06008 n=1 Tax=Blumeria graminis f. sp. triticale TaxID=1689686 RepID=A0A9W4GHV7_BLUGR|nr:BgTH12-06008 [Blumeria graminis f. sp. triticale]
MVPRMDREPIFAATATPPRSILRHSSKVRKVDDAGLDDGTTMASGYHKRRKIKFSSEAKDQVHVEMPHPSAKALGIIRGVVKKTIESHLQGDSHEYECLESCFRPKEMDHDDERVKFTDIKIYLLALTSYTSLLGKNFSTLINAILKIDWIGRDGVFVKVYINFLSSLASAQGAYVGLILEMLLSYFQGFPPLSGRVEGCPEYNQDQLFSRLHAALKYLVQLVPSASSVILSLVDKKFPFADDSKKLLINYVENLIQLTSYAPELKPDVLALITDRLVKIDVQMQVDLDDLDDEVASSLVDTTQQNLSGEEEDLYCSDSDTDSASADEVSGMSSKRLKKVRDNVEKLDTILELLFQVYTPCFSDPNSAVAVSTFETLLAHFANIILPTYRSRHTQFLLFHFAQKSEHLVDQFAGTCVQLAFQTGRPAILRQSAAAYLASFVARGANVQPQIVQTVFDLIGRNLDHIRAENEISCRGPDLQRYGTFYAMTQALLYIFCFRWRDLIIFDVLDDDDPVLSPGQDFTWIPGIKEILTRTIYSKLNPLKVCSPSIVAEFAKIAHHLKFIYVYPLLETNKRIRLGQFSVINVNGALRGTGSDSNEKWHQLDAYFPFDPYQLPISKRWIEGDYVQWKGIPGLDQGQDDDSDDNILDNENNDEDTATEDEN